ncbi:hypothetical protein, partial [Actinacidiphila oryziradicis]|uniref:hypothetical protein n=1 Tax=Actinacidiphila oryziradicis TaxID=2571141 RepID=UPI0023F18C31
ARVEQRGEGLLDLVRPRLTGQETDLSLVRLRGEERGDQSLVRGDQRGGDERIVTAGAPVGGVLTGALFGRIAGRTRKKAPPLQVGPSCVREARLPVRPAGGGGPALAESLCRSKIRFGPRELGISPTGS